MNKRQILFIVVFAFSLLLNTIANAQSIPVGTPVLDDYYRRMQLIGKVDSNESFTIRPLTNVGALKVADVFDPDSSLRLDRWGKPNLVSFARGKGIFRILPLSWQQQFNSNHPYGWNDGGMIPAKGYQTMISGGVYLKYGPLSIQLRPEYVYAANLPFNGFASGHEGVDLAQYYLYHNQIDNPERYGNGAYSKLFWGQSNITLSLGAIAVGLSNENLWWGPGIKNGIVLSNNAPGFKHFTINTKRPLNTFLGSFEGQIVAGRLDGSGLPPLSLTSLPNDSVLYIPKRNDWRYFTGFNINYHLKWVPGLTLGLTRTFDAYKSDVKGISGYFPLFFPYLKESTPGGAGDPFARDQYTSIYTRWLFVKAKAEFYFEYGLNDNSYNLADFIGSPDHSRAYTVGLRKMLPINGHADRHIMITSEITQLSQSPDRLVRQSLGWYIHSGVTDGQTHLGQVLGSGTGSGGNIQSLDIDWVSQLTRFGIGIERYEHDVDYYQAYITDLNGYSRNWVDLAFTLRSEWSYKNLLLNAKLQGIKSLNYEWVLKNYTTDQGYIPNNTVYNIHAELGVTYRF